MSTATIKYTINNQGAHRFTMWLFIVTTSMIFAGLTSAFLVRQGAGGAWAPFAIPETFKISTLLILLSSVFLQVAHIANKKKQPLLTMLGLFFTMVLGVLFCIYQIQGWKQLTDMGIYLSFNPNPAGPFFYVITFLHAAHLAFGLLFLLIAFGYSIYYWKRPENSTNTTGILAIRTDLLTLFWHFMGILWVYLYLFLSYYLK